MVPAASTLAGKPFRLISRDDVYDAVRGMPNPIRAWQGQEGPRWQLVVTPGSLKIRTVDLNRQEAYWQRRLDERMKTEPTATLGDVMPKRSTIKHWSSKSRTRMTDTLLALDYTPLFVGERKPVMVTLTLPGDHWLDIAPNGARYKYLIDRFRQEYRRTWGGTMPGPWKMEFQRRRAPHHHILTLLPVGRSRGRGQTFEEWAHDVWARICLAEDYDPRDDLQRAAYQNHRAHGVHIAWADGPKGSDPRSMSEYFSKHGVWGSKEYQNAPPEEWVRAAEDEGIGVGQFWGYWVLKKAEGVIDLNPAITPSKSPASDIMSV